MIDYEGKDQSYPSGRYCRRIESLFAEHRMQCNGNCYYFGYNVTVEAEFHNQRTSWYFLRHQTTQRGFFIPKNAHEYAECTVTIQAEGSQNCFLLKRPLFGFRSNFSKGFRLQGKISDAISEKLQRFLSNYDVKRLEVKDGVLTCTLIDEPEQPLDLARHLQELIPD